MSANQGARGRSMLGLYRSVMALDVAEQLGGARRLTFSGNSFGD